MRLLKWGSKVPSTKQYNLVTNDDYDTRIPLHPEEAFQYGITFHAKYIGTMDVPRPTSRVEIVAAMRRIRYEFKAKGVKKKKVTVEVSIDGVRVSVRTKKVTKKKEGSKLFGGSSKHAANNDADAGTSGRAQELLHHPIYRIFYVSHDSSDLKIFSYIARDGATNLFRCNVFKSNKKSQAMRIVRTVGQAFEVCHKLSANTPEPAASGSAADEGAASVSEAPSEPPKKEAVSESGGSDAGGSSASAVPSTSGTQEKAVRPQKLDLLPPPPRKESRRSPQRTIPTPSLNIPELPECVTNVDPLPAASSADGTGSSLSSTTPLSAQHELQLLKERLEQQSQQTRAAVAQLLLLRDQLAAEQAARCEAQARTHQLLVHNKELLDHITALVAHLQERERGSRPTPISVQQLTMVPQVTATAPQVAPGSVLANHMANDNAVILDLFAQNSQLRASAQNLHNNNVQLSSLVGTPVLPSTPVNGQTFPFNNNNNYNNNLLTEQLITQFQNMGNVAKVNPLNCNRQYFQNCNAFPNIPPLVNHYNNLDLETLIQQNRVFTRSDMNLQSLGNHQRAQSPNSSISQSSLFTPSPGPTSKDSTPDGLSSDDAASFIMPLSHTATLTTTDTDGRVRLIVPVSPSGSTSDFGEMVHSTNEPRPRDNVSMVTLDITDESGNTRRALPAAPPITRTTSEKVPNRSEMMATMRAQWTRHTTK